MLSMLSKIQWRRYAGLSAMLIFPMMGALYALVNKPGKQVYSLVTDLDVATPFIKYFALPYSIWIFYIYACVVYFYFKNRNVYYLSLACYVVCALCCYGIYMVFQTTVPRPVITGNDPVALLVKFIYNRDQPYNCFPSIHCFSSYMVMRVLYRSGFRNKWNQIAIYGMSVTIILSTLFVKQHVILDVLSAFLLVEVVYWGLSRLQAFAFPAMGRQVPVKAQGRM